MKSVNNNIKESPKRKYMEAATEIKRERESLLFIDYSCAREQKNEL